MLHQVQWVLRHHGQWLRSTHVEDLEPGDVEYTDEESLGSLGGQSLVDTLYEPGEETVVDGLGQSTDWVDDLQTKRLRIKRLQLLLCLPQKTKLFFSANGQNDNIHSLNWSEVHIYILFIIGT